MANSKYNSILQSFTNIKCLKTNFYFGKLSPQSIIIVR